jgi:hypothetical protein
VGVASVASATTVESLAFHRDAFIFGTADLEDMSKYGGLGWTAGDGWTLNAYLATGRHRKRQLRLAAWMCFTDSWLAIHKWRAASTQTARPNTGLVKAGP